MLETMARPLAFARRDGAGQHEAGRGDDWIKGTRLMSAPLSQAEVEALADAGGQPRPFGAASDLLVEGERVEHLYIVNRGWAFRYKLKRDGQRQIVALLLPGDVVNLDALAGGRARYGVRSVRGAEFVPIRCGQMRDLAGRHPGINKMLMRLALTEASVLTQWLQVLGGYSADQRLAHLFCELSVRLSGDGQGVATFEMPLTQELIGEVVGLTGVHVNRMLRSLRERGLLRALGRKVTLPDPAGLHRLSEFDPQYLRLG